MEPFLNDHNEKKIEIPQMLKQKFQVKAKINPPKQKN